MNDIVTIALLKTLEKNSKQIRLPVGEHPVDSIINLRVRGTVKKGQDVEYTPTVDIPLLATMALLLEKSGFQRERAKELLIEAMTEAINDDVAGEERVAERVKDIEAAMVHVREITASLPKKTKTGPTNVVAEIIWGM